MSETSTVGLCRYEGLRYRALIQTNRLQVLLRFMYSGRVDVDSINPAKIMKLITASDLYQVLTAMNKLQIKLDLRSTMSSPRTGILSLIRFNPGQD